MKKRILPVILALIISLAAAIPACAASIDDIMVSGDTVSQSGTADSSLFASGQTIDSSGDVNGILFAAGYSIKTGGSGEYILAAGYNVDLSGKASRDAFLAGYSVTVGGRVERDAFAAGNLISISGTVGRNLYAAGNSVYISGTIDGDVYLSAETVTISSGTVINGTLRYSDNAKTDISTGAEIGSTEIYHVESSADNAPNTEENTVASFNWFGKLLGFAGLIALAFVLLWLTGIWEKLDGKYTGVSFGSYAAAFGIGCAVLVGLPVISVILMISGFGVRLAFILLALYAAVIMASPVFISFFIGRLLWRTLLKKQCCYWLELPIGILIYKLLSLIPFVKIFVVFVGVCFGLGVIVLLLGKRKSGSGTGLTQQNPFSPSSDSDSSEF